MKIAINGAGIAGPTLAWWLRRYGHEPVLFEQAASLRTSGYDAAACVSLLAGEGTGLAMTEAYVLAGELHQANGNHEVALQNYESKLHRFLVEKQTSARRTIGFFVPRTRVGLALRDLGTNLFSAPWIARLTLKRVFQDNFELPDYEHR